MKKRKPKLLDLFCGAGGAGEGYVRAGFDVTGVDLYPQPENPHRFIQADWCEYLKEHGGEYDVIHASPVCKGYANLNSWGRVTHKREIPLVREQLLRIGKPYVIENIHSAKWDMIDPIQVCGSPFGLRVRRHRMFESSLNLISSGCDHGWQDADQIYLRRGRYSKPTPTGVCPNTGGSQLFQPGTLKSMNRERERELRSEGMGIDWMSWEPLTQAIPPRFTQFLGRQIIPQLRL